MGSHSFQGRLRGRNKCWHRGLVSLLYKPNSSRKQVFLVSSPLVVEAEAMCDDDVSQFEFAAVGCGWCTCKKDEVLLSPPRVARVALFVWLSAHYLFSYMVFMVCLCVVLL